MKHEAEFQRPQSTEAKLREDQARELAACYARVFLGNDDGKRVLADLRKKFGLHRLIFQRGEGGRYDSLAAALLDGERHVMSEIEDAIGAGTPPAISTNQPNP